MRKGSNRLQTSFVNAAPSAALSWELALAKYCWDKTDIKHLNKCRFCHLNCKNIKQHVMNSHTEAFEKFAREEQERLETRDTGDPTVSYLDAVIVPFINFKVGKCKYKCTLCPRRALSGQVQHLQAVHVTEYNHFLRLADPDYQVPLVQEQHQPLSKYPMTFSITRSACPPENYACPLENDDDQTSMERYNVQEQDLQEYYSSQMHPENFGYYHDSYEQVTDQHQYQHVQLPVENLHQSDYTDRPSENMDQYNDAQSPLEDFNQCHNAREPSQNQLLAQVHVLTDVPIVKTEPVKDEYLPVTNHHVAEQVPSQLINVPNLNLVKRKIFDNLSGTDNSFVNFQEPPKADIVTGAVNFLAPPNIVSEYQNPAWNQSFEKERATSTTTTATDSNVPEGSEGRPSSVFSAGPMTTKIEVGRKILALKKEFALPWKTIAEIIGMPKALVANACVGPDPLPENVANQLGNLFELDEDAVTLLQRGDSPD